MWQCPWRISPREPWNGNKAEHLLYAILLKWQPFGRKTVKGKRNPFYRRYWLGQSEKRVKLAERKGSCMSRRSCQHSEGLQEPHATRLWTTVMLPAISCMSDLRISCRKGLCASPVLPSLHSFLPVYHLCDPTSSFPSYYPDCWSVPAGCVRPPMPQVLTAALYPL